MAGCARSAALNECTATAPVDVIRMGDLKMAVLSVLLVVVVMGLLVAANLHLNEPIQTDTVSDTDDGIIRSLNASADERGVSTLTVTFYNHTGAFDLRVIDADHRITMWRVESGQTSLDIRFFKLRELPLRIVAEGAEDSRLGTATVVNADGG